MSPIFVECTIVNLTTGRISGKMMKVFDFIGDFNAWYDTAKTDQTMILNIMHYNPVEKARLKDVYDVRLLGVSREFPT